MRRSSPLDALDRVIIALLAEGRVTDVRTLYAARGCAAELGAALASLVHVEPAGALREAALEALDGVPAADRPIAYWPTGASEKGAA